ncbi:MAG: rubrerythrin [Treponema sp.]|nr:rubrerythrin [Treponema sp.]
MEDILIRDKTQEISKKDMKVLLKSQQGELDAVLMYNALAKVAKIQKDKDTFRQLAKEEGHHASVFHNLTKTELKPRHGKEILLPILYRIFPRWILYPGIAQGEYAAVKTYAPVAQKFPEVENVRNDEKRHGDTVRGLLK